jgi:16S rRNA A1518/A1519 N6-dimethyltransferase RsmA/KsgA/DIM1 with predicted DNA glycosylase/AP lyase activity
MQYGVDVGAVRFDDVDRRVMARVQALVARGVRPTVLEVGCGSGRLAAALCAMGASVTAIDIAPPKETEVPVIVADLATWLFARTDQQYHVVVMQRVLHYVPYSVAVTVLQHLSNLADELYLAVSGCDSAIAAYYPDVHKKPDERFCVLSVLGQQLFSMSAPLCLYQPAEVMSLLHDTGWQPTWSRVSAFGNVKVVATSRMQSTLWF